MPEFKTKEEYEKWKAQRQKELEGKKNIKPEEPVNSTSAPPIQTGQQSTEKKCPYCAMMIPREAKVCPHCRKNQPSAFKAVLVIIAIALFVGPCIFIISNIDTGPSSVTEVKKEKQYPTEIDACVMSTRSVENYLKAPSTAKFPWTCSATKLQSGAWQVISYVDSQNSFGAMIRTNYLWTAEYIKDRHEWNIVYLKIGEQEFVKAY